jgi:hypothetical protein
MKLHSLSIEHVVRGEAELDGREVHYLYCTTPSNLWELIRLKGGRYLPIPFADIRGPR